MNLIEFCKRCEEVVISDNKIHFTQFNSDRSGGHIQRMWWSKKDEDVISLIHENIDEYNECLNDEERIEFVRELVTDCLSYDEKSVYSDYDNISFYNDFFNYTVDSKTPKESFEDSEDVIFCEDYPYRYGTYSGIIDLHTLEILECETDGDHSPCGGADEIYVHIPLSLLKRV